MNIQEWVAEVEAKHWSPTIDKPIEEQIVDYIRKLERRIFELEKFKSDEMWRRDQESPHRMGL